MVDPTHGSALLQDTDGALFGEPDSIEDSADGERGRWKSCNLLSLDGGGIRGYWTLLVLRHLMEYIAEKEENDDKAVHHSFSPEEWPENVSQAPHTEEERQGLGNAITKEAECRALSRDRRYLPCHYFDYICGSSTGALIAIMLGRFRMTVADCIYEYENLAEEVFGKPRFFTTLHFVFGNRTKYKAAKLQRVFERVTAERDERTNNSQRRSKFPYRRDLCKTFVTTLKTESKQQALAQLYIIRSYDHDRRNSHSESQGPSRRSTRGATMRRDTGASAMASQTGQERRKPKRIINHGDAQDFEIWQVARAATAAPLYFEPLKIQYPTRPEYMLFTDGGFNYTNNPTREGTLEIEEAYGIEHVGAVVSIGTARRDQRPKEKGLLPILSRIRNIANMATDPEIVHRELEGLSEREQFPYFRLNDPGALDIGLDEWAPKRDLFHKTSGYRTIKTIKDAFNDWAKHHRTQNLFRKCAAELVDRRKARMVADGAMWERYATCAKYKCQTKGCDLEEFVNREAFRAHLITHPQHRLLQPDSLDNMITACRTHWRYKSKESV